MKHWKRVIGKRLSQEIWVTNNKFGFILQGYARVFTHDLYRFEKSV